MTNALAEKRIAERYIPRGYELKYETSDVHIYYGDNSEVAKELNFKEVQYYAIAFKAKGKNSIAHIRFRDEDRRDQWSNELIGRYLKRARDMQARRSQRNRPHNVKIGDIFYSSWGYDQTNINFYQVVKTTERTVTVQEIAGAKEYEGDMHGNKTAIKDSFIINTELGKRYPEQFQPMQKTVNMDSDRPYIKINSFEYAWLDDGRSHGFSEWA